MSKRPSLSDLAAPKPAAQVPADLDETPVADEAAPDELAKRGRSAKTILVRLEAEGWRELKRLADDRTVETGERHTLNALCVEALNALLKANGRPPLA